MGQIKVPQAVKIICAILYSKNWASNTFSGKEENEILQLVNAKITSLLEKKGFANLVIGSISQIINFDFSDYYNNEMGEEINRYWISFEASAQCEHLHTLKIVTNEIEHELFCTQDNRRKVNIDPGYIDGAKLVLFSTKNYSHRIYLGQGIYGEVTSLFKNGRFETLPWTYPDYKTDVALNFFTRARESLFKRYETLVRKHRT